MANRGQAATAALYRDVVAGATGDSKQPICERPLCARKRLHFPSKFADRHLGRSDCDVSQGATRFRLHPCEDWLAVLEISLRSGQFAQARHRHGVRNRPTG